MFFLFIWLVELSMGHMGSIMGLSGVASQVWGRTREIHGVPVQDGRQSDKAKKFEEDLLKELGVSAGKGYFATREEDSEPEHYLNRREKNILESHYALIKVPCQHWSPRILSNISVLPPFSSSLFSGQRALIFQSDILPNQSSQYFAEWLNAFSLRWCRRQTPLGCRVFNPAFQPNLD